MRILIINLLATALLLFGATSASAFAFTATQGGADLSGVVAPSDTVTINVYLDADPGSQFLTVALTYDDDGILAYEPGSSTMPTYITTCEWDGNTQAPANCTCDNPICHREIVRCWADGEPDR